MLLQPDETCEFLRNVSALARDVASERRIKLLCLLVECGIVELVQKMWRRHLRPQLLEQDLPDWIDASLRVIFFVHVQVTIIFVLSVCLFVCLFVCEEFFSAVFDPISIKLGRMHATWRLSAESSCFFCTSSTMPHSTRRQSNLILRSDATSRARAYTF